LAAPGPRPADPPPAILPLAKPAGDSTARPGAPSVEPRTDFDVDLHEVRAGDTYSTISQKYLGDTRYARAIQAFNGDRPVGQLGKVQVPPIHVLRKQFAAYIGKPEATDRQTNSGTGGTTEWQPAASGERRGSSPPSDAVTKTYTVPPGGATMRGVAKAAFGDDQQWSKVWDLNPKYKPDEVLPEGTKLLLPPVRHPPATKGPHRCPPTTSPSTSPSSPGTAPRWSSSSAGWSSARPT
jgi:nucleoid-associated protein YgaU